MNVTPLQHYQVFSDCRYISICNTAKWRQSGYLYILFFILDYSSINGQLNESLSLYEKFQNATKANVFLLLQWDSLPLFTEHKQVFKSKHPRVRSSQQCSASAQSVIPVNKATIASQANLFYVFSFSVDFCSVNYENEKENFLVMDLATYNA